MTIPTPCRRLTTLGTALTVALLVGACSGPADERAETNSDVPTTSVSATSVTEASGTPTSRAATTAEGPAIATTADPTGGSIEITSLKRESSKLATLRFVLVNKGTKPFNSSLIGAGGRDVAAVYLVDPDGLKKYLTVQDTERRCLCTTNTNDIKPGDRLNLFATFPAPPAEVKTVTVVVPSFQPMNDVPLS